MSQNNLYKGFEVELFTGSLNSHIGVSAEIEKKFPDFVKEPDNRNVEYITTPEKDYNFLYEKLLIPRKKLRRWLNKKELTIIPSSTLCFKHDIQFQNPYKDYFDSFIYPNRLMLLVSPLLYLSSLDIHFQEKNQQLFQLLLALRHHIFHPLRV